MVVNYKISNDGARERERYLFNLVLELSYRNRILEKQLESYRKAFAEIQTLVGYTSDEG